MGTFNVGCVLTGLEIKDGDEAYILTLSENAIPYEGHRITSPPIKGIYDGVGGIIVTEDVPCLDLAKDDEFGSDDMELNVFVHKAVFESLGDLPCSDVGTIADKADEKLDRFSTMLESQLESRVTGEKEELETAIAMAVSLSIFEVYPRSHWGGRCAAIFLEAYGNDEKIQNAKELMRRADMLKMAEVELRRPLVPMTWGANELGNGARDAMLQTASRIMEQQILLEESCNGTAGPKP